MPLYRLYLQADMLSDQDKAAFAAKITKFHCDLTGLEPAYVKVLFAILGRGDTFVAAAARPVAILTVLIRAGRSTEYKQNMVRQLWMMLQTATRATDEQMLVAIEEAPASQAMEMGLVMPDLPS